MNPATAEKVEDKWSSMILEMNRCIANWQKSGQGEGGIDDADNEGTRSLAVWKTVVSMHLLVDRVFSEIGNSIFFTCGKCSTVMIYWGWHCKS